MPQLTYPFYYVADLATVLLLFAALLVAAAVYLLPLGVRAEAAQAALAPLLLSPLEQFRAAPLLGGEVAGVHLSLTALGAWAVLGAGVALLLLAGRSPLLAGDRFGASVRGLTASVGHLATEGGRNTALAPLTPLFVALFTLLLLLNLVANVPYGYSATSSLVVAMGASLAVWVYCTALGLAANGVAWFAHFVPAGTPLPLVPLLVLIETVSYTARALSLGVRLFANMLAGHTLLAILAGFLGPLLVAGPLAGLLSLLPGAVFVALVGLEVAVSFIQAYVFLVLTHSYLLETGAQVA